MKGNVLGFLAMLSIACRLNAGIIAEWNFNSPTPDGDVNTGTTDVSLGSGKATLVGGANGSFVTGDPRHDPSGNTDNSAWRTTKYPAAEAGNKSAGVRFDVDTSGYESISLNWHQQNSATASRYLRVQYTLDGTSFYDADGVAIFADGVFTNKVCDLSGILGAANNPAFGFQIVTEWESSATGAGGDSYVATKEGSKYSTSGAIRFDLVTVSGTPIPGANTPPAISTVSNQVLRVNQSVELGFTVSDQEDAADSLTVEVASSDTVVIPEANIALGGSGGNRTVSITATEQTGSSTVSLSVTDTGGRTAGTSFMVAVLPANTPPEISSIPPTNTLVDTPAGPIPFVVGDAETAAECLTLSASSSNAFLVPDVNILFGGSGSNRTITVIPAPGQTGVAAIWISVSDGTNQNSVIFPVVVRPSAQVVFCDHFDYANGSLVTNSAFLWGTRSGIAGQCQVENGQLLLCATQSEDVVARVIGAPYTKSNSVVLYAAFNVHFLSLPKPAPGLFAHFADGSTLRGRISAGTTNAADGCFRLYLANGAGPPMELTTDLDTNTTYRVVTRYEIDTALTTLWLNPSAESDVSLSATDPQSATAIIAYDFRQDPDIGAIISIDDLKVGLSFGAVCGAQAVTPSRLTVEWDGTNLRLIWPDASLVLQSATEIEGPYNEVLGATSPYRAPPDGSARFFRLSN